MPGDSAAKFAIFSAGIISGSGTPVIQVTVPQCGRENSPNPNFMSQFECRFGPGGFANGALNLGTRCVLGHFSCQFGWVEALAGAGK